MIPALMILAAWAAFGGSHILLSSSRLRGWLTGRFGAHGFIVIYSCVATLTLSMLMAVVVFFADQGWPGPAHFGSSALRLGLAAVAFLGAALAAAGLINYPRSPMAVLAQRGERAATGDKPPKPPTAIERIARHPFFAGLAIFAAAHALMADTLAGAVYFAGFAVLALVGMPMQDRKLRRRWHLAYSDFEARTRLVPFAAPQVKIPGRERISPGKWLVPTAVGFLVPGLLHPVWAWGSGAPLAGFILIFGLTGVIAGLIGRRKP